MKQENQAQSKGTAPQQLIECFDCVNYFNYNAFKDSEKLNMPAKKYENLTFWNIFLFSLLLLSGCSTHATGKPLDTPTFATTATLIPTEAFPTIGKIAFVSDRDGKYNIVVMNADGRDQKNLTNNLFNSLVPAWSPDGKNIAFTSDINNISQIFTMKTDGSDQKQLTHDNASSSSPAWSPDGRQILFISDRDMVLSDDRIPISEVYIMNSDGSNQERVTNNRDFERDLSWSPNGDMIAISVNPRSASGVYFPEEIYLMDLKGVVQKQLTRFDFYNSYPKWSPNGKLIAFASSGSGQSKICIMKADGSDQVCLIVSTNNTDLSSHYVNNISPSWSPDGSHIVFSSNRDGDYDLYIVRADGTGLTQLTNDPGDETYPVWSLVP